MRGGLPFSVASSQTMNDNLNASRANLTPANGPAALPMGSALLTSGLILRHSRFRRTTPMETPASIFCGVLAFRKSRSRSRRPSTSWRGRSSPSAPRRRTPELRQSRPTGCDAGVLRIRRHPQSRGRLMQMLLKFAFLVESLRLRFAIAACIVCHHNRSAFSFKDD